MVPDIDHTGSKIGRAVPIIDEMISSVFGHRTFTHSQIERSLNASISVHVRDRK
ncbi:metal-dependent hydrolase [Caldifermentibacillus hisashii]|uniref:metal-dependent hydrolase n=1 Tax=Caldifermentibacillus hisashii TaxID=996558 RepID=UPI0031B6CCEE